MTTDGLAAIKLENLDIQLEILRRVLPNMPKKTSPMKINTNEDETYQLLISAIEYINYLNDALAK